MFQAIYALAMLALLLVPHLVVRSYERRQARRSRQELRTELTRLAAAHRLTFSAQELLPDTALGLDARAGQLLVVHRLPEGALVHRLAALQDLSAPEHFEGPAADGPLWLQLAHRGHAPLRICFFDCLRDPRARRRGMERKARNWRALLEQLTRSTPSARTI